MNLRSRALGLALSLIMLSVAYGVNIVQDSGNRVVQERQIIERFDRIKISTLINVVFFTGDDFKVRVIGDENVVNFVTTTVVKERLKIRCEDILGQYKGDLRCEVTIPRSMKLKRIKKDGSGFLKGKVRLWPNNENRGVLFVFGSGETDLEINAATSILMWNMATGNFNVKIDADSVVFFCSALGAVQVHVDVDILEVTTHAESTVNIRGNCKSAHIKEREKGISDFSQLKSKIITYQRFDQDDELIEEKIIE